MHSIDSTLTQRRSRLETQEEPSHDIQNTLPTRKSPPRLLNRSQLPDWLKDNPHVYHGYRPVSFSSITCLQSCTYLHNETINIYSHLIPAVVCGLLQLPLQQYISTHFPAASLTDRIILSFNLLAATLTFTFSAAYHTLMNHSPSVSSLVLRIDYVGILVLTLGSFVSGIYVGFYCAPRYQWVHWSSIATLAVATAILVLHPRLQGPSYRPVRTLSFVLTGLSGFAPITHGVLLYGWDEMWTRSGMPYYLVEGAVYAVAAFFFVSRVPESLHPGRFDLVGCSHNIFHVLVVIACAVHLHGVVRAFEWNYHHNRSCVASF